MNANAETPSSSSGKRNATEKPSNNAEFQFVVMQGPRDALQHKTRKQIRSHVTKVQHQRTREKLRNNQARSLTSGAASKVTGTVDSKDASTLVKKEDETDVAPEYEGNATKLEQYPKTSLPSFAAEPPVSLTIPHSASFEALSRGVMAFRTFALQDTTNTISKSLGTLGLELSSVMSLYEHTVKLQVDDFEQQYAGAIEPGVGFSRFIAFLSTDPLLLTIGILIATRYHLGILKRDVHSRLLIPILELESYLVRGVNAALHDPVRAVSNPLLLTVALCAGYELKCGNVDGYHFHMAGLVRMLGVRGGLRAVGLSDPYLERTLVWHDVNASQLIGSPPWFANMEKSDLFSPRANMNTFREPIEEERRRSNAKAGENDRE